MANQNEKAIIRPIEVDGSEIEFSGLSEDERLSLIHGSKERYRTAVIDKWKKDYTIWKSHEPEPLETRVRRRQHFRARVRAAAKG